VASQAAHLPPVSTLFAALLGYNPVAHLIGTSALAHVSASQRAVLVGRTFFPHLISAPFHKGLHTAFDFAIVACLLGAAASWVRGGRYIYADERPAADGTVPSDEEIADPVPQEPVTL
jgi:hypothetical protein